MLRRIDGSCSLRLVFSSDVAARRMPINAIAVDCEDH